MRSLFACMVLLAIGAFAVSQDNVTTPTVSEGPLTGEQIAIYRTVLKDYLKSSDATLNLSALTEPLEQFDDSCVKHMRLGNLTVPATVLHRLGQSLVSGTRIVLVDPERQRSTVKETDPQNLMKKAIDEHEKVTEERLDQSVKQAFRTGLFTLSEIVFDNAHHRAVVSYSFVCGMLCGNGNTLVLKNIDQNWKIVKRCEGWIS